MYSFDSRVRYSEIDANEKMTLASILNYFQDCSTFHSEDIGVGLEFLKEKDMFWVLSYWQIDIKRYPSLCEKIRIGTYPYDFKGFLGYRNFVLFDEAGEQIAYANSIWSLLNMKTGHPGRVTEEMKAAYVLEERLQMEYEPRKIAIPGDGVREEIFEIRPNHIDSNHHVNNGQYVQMAMDYLPEGYEIHRMRAEYKRSAVLHDRIQPIINREQDKVIVSLCDKSAEPYAVMEFK